MGKADPPAGNKVLICHKGKVISVAVESVPAHKAHGDCDVTGMMGNLKPGDDCSCP